MCLRPPATPTRRSEESASRGSLARVVFAGHSDDERFDRTRREGNAKQRAVERGRWCPPRACCAARRKQTGAGPRPLQGLRATRSDGASLPRSTSDGLESTPARLHITAPPPRPRRTCEASRSASTSPNYILYTCRRCS